MNLPFEMESGAPVPETLFGYVSVRSQGGVSPLDADTPTDASPFRSSEGDHREVAANLESTGFTILAESQLGKAVAGPPGAFEELTGGTIVPRERLLYAEAGRQRYVTHLDIVGPDQPEALGAARPASEVFGIDAVLLERPRILMSVFPSPIPPTVQKFHLRLPDDEALLLGALGAHRRGHTGQGVTVAMVDSGWFAHPYFISHGYDVRPPVTMVPGTSPSQDPVGHGTGESANLFAVAPGATLRPYRASNDAGQLIAAIAGFVQAKADGPAIMTNSWGGDQPFPPTGQPDAHERVWALEILDAVQKGIVVVFSGGNGQFSIEPQVSGVIAAGGALVTPQLDLQASDYTSGYASPWYPGVTVPTVCGLVGMRPRAQYLMLPIPPGCEIDGAESQPVTGDTPDGTAPDDGWALFSGTSAAAPQVAGAAAVVLGVNPGFSPAEVRQLLVDTATDVTTGVCHPRFNQPATTGHDLATGDGLVNLETL